MRIKRFQEGGAMSPEEQNAQAQGQPQGSPEGEAQGQEQDPMAQILAAAQSAVESNDPQMALQVCAALVQLAQGAQGGQPQQAPAYQKKGGKMVRIR